MTSSNNQSQGGGRICSLELPHDNMKNVQFLIKKNYEACKVTKKHGPLPGKKETNRNYA